MSCDLDCPALLHDAYKLGYPLKFWSLDESAGLAKQQLGAGNRLQGVRDEKRIQSRGIQEKTRAACLKRCGPFADGFRAMATPRPCPQCRHLQI